MAEFTPHPKPPKRAKKPGAMRTKPKTAREFGTAVHAAMLEGADVATAIAAATKPAKAQKLAGAARTAKPVATATISKTDLILAMLRAPGGATSKALEAATGWQPHSVRGLLGSLRKKGVPVTSDKQPKQPTVYSIPENGVGDVV